MGTRLWGRIGERKRWNLNLEGLFQFGSFGPGDIRAWTLASIVGHTFAGAPLSPRAALSANIASGDANPDDPDLQTFNPLFPRGNYFSGLALLGPYNFFNVHPFLTLTLDENLAFTTDVNFFWRYSREDGVYAPNGQLLRASTDGGGSDARYVGATWSNTLEWSVTRHMTATAIYAHVFPGAFIRETGPHRDIDFVELTWQFIF